MANDISLTVRLSSQLSKQLQSVAKELGMTKTNLLRSAIHDFLVVDDVALDFSVSPGEKDRFVLNVNQITYSLLESTCKKHSQSMNAVIGAVGVLALERATKWLQSARP